MCDHCASIGITGCECSPFEYKQPEEDRCIHESTCSGPDMDLSCYRKDKCKYK